MEVKETIIKVYNGLNDIEVKGAKNVMLLGQIMFDLGNLVQQFEQEESMKQEEKDENAEEAND